MARRRCRNARPRRFLPGTDARAPAARRLAPAGSPHTASSRGCTPLFLKAEPVSTGTIRPVSVPIRRHRLIVAASGSSPSRKRSSTASSISTTASISAWRLASASACISAGTSWHANSAPRVSASQTTAFIAIRSTTPTWFASVPMGSWIATGSAPSRSRIIAMQRRKIGAPPGPSC